MDADEIALLAETAEHVFAGDDPERMVAELAEAGIGDPVADPAVAAALLGTQGRVVGRSTLLDLALAGDDHAGGVRVVLPLPGTWRPPGSRDGGAIDVDGIVLIPEKATRYLVHTGSHVVPVAPEALHGGPVEGFDPGLGAHRVIGTLPSGAAAERAWHRVVGTGRRAIAHELAGAGQRALDLAIEYVGTRHQFGRPIAAAQAVRHRLVDAHVGLEAARAALDAIPADPGGELGALTVKALAGRAALAAVAAAQQLCGAMGFTAEHPLHAVVRRAYLLDSLFGCAEDLEPEIGALLAARGARSAPLVAL
ncbi:acyl-CoA dehydrogenase family protein [Actinomadura vinacea]|uniref:Acyl-CoA dehydrogenase family protein n=1 Tax=Actinomadura vinacea TaxID=115336 RepID=A0ABP5VI64_9ACTN